MLNPVLRFLPQIFNKSRPIHLTLFVTGRCNARCPFCFYSEGSEKNDELTLAEYEKISRSMGSLLWLAISGGEPLLREDLSKIICLFYDNNRPSIILLPTNGLLPQRTLDAVKDILTHCTESVFTVKLSLDGDKSLHDKLRGVDGAYDKMHETYELLRPLLREYKNFELGINTVFCADNQDGMDGVIDHVLGMKDIRTHTISLARGEMREQPSDEIDMNKYLAASERLTGGLHDGSQPSYGFSGARVKAAQDVIQRQLIHKTATTGQRQLPCYAGRLNLVITETGDLYPCESFIDEHKLGNLRDCGRDGGFDINKMLKSDNARDVINKIKRECFCTHECYMMTNILFNPKLFPRLGVEYAKL